MYYEKLAFPYQFIATLLMRCTGDRFESDELPIGGPKGQGISRVCECARDHKFKHQSRAHDLRSQRVIANQYLSSN
jgi:hypothetical protein